MRRLKGVPNSRLTYQLQAHEMTYTIDPSSIHFFETRNGMAATANIILNGTQHIGTITDFPERIVTDVEFVSELARTAFAVTARQILVQVFGSTDQSDSAFISEYARGLLQAAEQSLLQQIKDNPPQPGK
jgi:hypothetical protein